MPRRNFKRGAKDKYSMFEKEELGKLCVKYKEEYNQNVEQHANDVTFNDKRKKHTTQLPREGYLARAVREYYPDLQGFEV